MSPRPSALGQRYAFVVVGVTFVSLLAAAGLRSAPGVLMVPWEKAFGWERDTISLAAAIGLFLFGLMGPFAAALMQSIGVRRTLTGALALMSASIGASLLMTEPWQLVVSWGIVSGMASGCVAGVLSATIVNRWFVSNRGLIMGLLTASTATGSLVFLPIFAAISQSAGWKPVVVIIAVLMALLAPVAWLLMRERPSDLGTEPYGAPVGQPPPPAPAPANPLVAAFSALGQAAKTRDFWLLFATFFVCGFTTNGLVGVHMISMCADYGMAAGAAGGILAMMGLFDLIGTTASGWATDRYDPRKLLFAYYGLRGLSLLYLPHADFTFFGLSLFAVFYGLDWIATVPPTLKLTTQAFGEARAPIIFGWIFTGHQIGAASAAFFAGVMRTEFGAYQQAFEIAGATALVAAVAALCIGRGRKPPALAMA
jgi:predicted MFS family arabinose efflux permease